jgi:hypothetical protein
MRAECIAEEGRAVQERLAGAQKNCKVANGQSF